MSKVWLVTGSGRGLGREIVLAALAAGDRVVATARDPQQLADLQERYGERIRPVALDVSDATGAGAAVEAALATFGRLDVLVNNAGFGHMVPFEQTPVDDFRAQIDTNFYGVVNLTRAALPVMRKQRSGHIIQISSVGGRVSTPGLSAYQAAKWAVGGFTGVLAKEVGHLGIKVTTLEPGGMRTGWGAEARRVVPDMLPDYEESVGHWLNILGGYSGKEASDPARVAAVVVKLASHANPPVHLLLGSDALQFAGLSESARAEADLRWREVTLSTDYSAPSELPEFPS
ncbi:MAG TPA: SDR family NAD(P)-dependent oxidoreductase [Steroidobacteraceae bacterium]|nr:SDR family NAD(P)-dependent oxidoreductase [Steroidobacteraceae bacterium]